MRRRYIVIVAAIVHFVVMFFFAICLSCAVPDFATFVIQLVSFPAAFLVPMPIAVMFIPLNSLLFGIGVAWFVHRRRLQRSGAVAAQAGCDEMAGTVATLRALILIALLFCLCLVPVARFASVTMAATFVLLFCVARLWIVRIARARSRDTRWCRRALVAVAGLAFASFSLLVLVPYPPTRPSEADRARKLSYAETVEAVRKMVAGRSVPLHMRFLWAVRWRTDFDVNRYFSVLTRIGPEPSYVLDYVVLGAQTPVLYSRKLWAMPYLTWDALLPCYASGDMEVAFKKWISRVQCDDSPDGYVQLLILYIEGPRFYQSGPPVLWDTRIVADRGEVERLLDSAHGRLALPAEKDAIKRAGPEPVVEMGDRSVSVTLVTCSDRGLMRTTYTITRAKPHRIEETRRQFAYELMPVLY